MNIEIIEQIHEGRNNIYTVKYNGSICVLKRPKDNSRKRKSSLLKQLERIKFWRKHGLSTIKAVEYHNGIIKTYVKGDTLKELIDKNEYFFSKKSVELKALKKFVRLLVKSRHFLHDMKGPNIVLSNGNNKFQIIDSGPIYKRSNKSSLKKEYQKILYIKWSKLLDSSKEKKYLKKFLKLG